MKTLKYLSIFLFFLTLTLPMQSQENSVVPQRTPEQEAAKQTEKLQQELGLTPEQTKQVYEINLKYARERQVSNTRSEAVERMKNKNADIQRILTAEQSDRLQTKRYERSAIETASGNRNQPSGSSGFRVPADYRSNPTVRIPSNDMNIRSSSFRQSPPTSQQTTQQSQAVRRSTLPASPSTTQQQPQSTPSAAPAVRNMPPQQSSPSVPAHRTEPASSSSRR
jgi:Spy/CpxP family protein refolding chaperone